MVGDTLYFCFVRLVCVLCVLFVWSEGYMSGLPFFLPTFNIASVLCTCISMYGKNMCIVNIS